MKKLTILAALALAGVLASVACGGDQKPADNPGSNTTTTTTSSGAASGSAAPASS